MKITLSILFLVLSTLILSAQSTWVAHKSSDTYENPLINNKESIKKGKELFNQLCTVCHGFKGKGDGMAGAALVPKPSNLTSPEVQNQSDGAIYWKLTEGKAPMASYKEILSEADRWHLVNFIKTFDKH